MFEFFEVGQRRRQALSFQQLPVHTTHRKNSVNDADIFVFLGVFSLIFVWCPVCRGENNAEEENRNVADLC